MKNSVRCRRHGDALKSVIGVFLSVAVATAMFTGCQSAGGDASGSSKALSEGASDTSSSDISSVVSEGYSSQSPSPSSAGSSKSGSSTASDPQDVYYTEKDEAVALEEFALGAVKLNGGLLKESFDYWSNFYLNIPNDNILYEYRLRSGINNPPGQRLGGWGIQLQGYYVNEWCSGFARMYAITGNKAFKDKAIYLMEEWFKCFKLRGAGFHEHYGALRWVNALLDVYLLLDRPDALDKLSEYYTWCKRNLPFDKKFGDNSTEWYTLSEAFFRAYQVTGDKKYLDYAKTWEYTEYWDLFKDASNVTPFAKKPVKGMNTYSYHIISHVNSLNGAAEAYRITGKKYYLDVMNNFYRWLKTGQMYSTGTFGCGLEWALPINEVMVDLNNNHYHAETGSAPCATRFANNLLTISGNAELGDWMEKILYNDVCAILKPKQSGADSIFMSYHDYNLNGGSKKYGWRDDPNLAWTSAGSTLPLEVTDFFNSVYYHEKNNLYVSMYTPSTVTWKRDDNTVKLTQKTDYPKNGTVNMSLSLTKSEIFSIKLRIPEWVGSGVSITVNGKQAPVNINSSRWAVLRRKWSNGDTITLNIPMKLWTAPYADTGFAGVMYGPVAMVATLSGGAKLSDVDISDLSKFTAAGDMNFKLSGKSGVSLKPYYQCKENEVYYLYLEE